MASNPYVNKVKYGDQTVMDISDTTAQESDVISGKTFYKASGARSTGTATTNYYSPDDTTETTLANILDDADLVPFYDTSATTKKNSTWANIKTKLADVFRKKIIGTFNGAGVSDYFCLLCTLHIDYARIDGATEIIIQERGRKTVARLNVLFASSADTDPDLQSFTVIGGQKNYFIAKSDTSTWQIYVTKSEPYSAINVIGFSPYIRQTGEVSVSVTWNLENASTLPSGRVQASYEHTLADFDDDSTHRLVTDTEKSTWNGITSLGTAALKDVPASGDAGQTEVVLGSDTRLTDARTPTAHTHTKTDITDFPTLATVATSGSYNDLTNKPTIPEAQIQSDWNQTTTTAKDYIKNKPTIPAAQVNSDWTSSSGVSEILHKPTLGTAAALDVATSGDASTAQVVKGDDTRLTDARTPTSHTHTTSQITDFPTITDTKNTAGSTDTSDKIYLVGAKSQGANPQTYSDNEVFAQDGVLSSKKLSPKCITALTGTGTAGQDKGSGSTNRYVPALWTFNQSITVADGEVYFIKIPVAGGTYGVWLSLNNGTNYYPVAVSNGKGRFTTHYGQNMVIGVTYESAGVCNCYARTGADALADVTGCFRVFDSYDSNTTYSAMSTSELTTGTVTTSRVVRSDYLKSGINSLIDTKINALDVTGASNIAASKTIKAWSETNGKVSLTTQDISITKSQVSDFPTLATVATSGSYSDLTGTPTIPDELADLSDDSTHRLVTDTEKSTWNDKCDNSVVAPVESGSIASRSYKKGEHFIKNGAFCTATADIASGTPLTTITNYEAGQIDGASIFASKVLTSSDNLNNITTFGMYSWGSSSVPTNAPASVSVEMEVIRYGAASIMQKVTSSDSIWVRVYSATSTSWTSWTKFALPTIKAVEFTNANAVTIGSQASESIPLTSSTSTSGYTLMGISAYNLYAGAAAIGLVCKAINTGNIVIANLSSSSITISAGKITVTGRYIKTT